MKTTHIKTYIFLVALFALISQSNAVQAQGYNSEYFMRDFDFNSYLELERDQYGWRDINIGGERLAHGQSMNMNTTFNTNTFTSHTGSNSNFVSNTQGGNLASIDSVYLNQVPYTGPEDIAKGIAFVIAIFVWSIIGALVITNRINKKVISNRIAVFKEANRNLQF